MDNDIIIKKLKIEEINQFSNMIINVFDEFVGKIILYRGMIRLRILLDRKMCWIGLRI